jgi:hypothetical protein
MPHLIVRLVIVAATVLGVVANSLGDDVLTN